MNAAIDKYAQYDAYVAKRTPQLVMEREATHAALDEAHGWIDWTPAMSAAYQTRDHAGLGRLIANAVHAEVVAKADDLAQGEASERFGI